MITPCFSNRADVYAVSSTSCDTHICGKPRPVTRRGLGIRRCMGFQALASSTGPSYQRDESVKYQFNAIDQAFTEPPSFQPCHLLLRSMMKETSILTSQECSGDHILRKQMLPRYREETKLWKRSHKQIKASRQGSGSWRKGLR